MKKSYIVLCAVLFLTIQVPVCAQIKNHIVIVKPDIQTGIKQTFLSAAQYAEKHHEEGLAGIFRSFADGGFGSRGTGER